MKFKILILVTLISNFIKAQDLREFNHGACIVKFIENDSTKYYLTWSSSFQNSWEHDIYKSVIFFNDNGELTTQQPYNIYIGNGNDEAQEPVNATTDKVHNNILSVWEDGNDTDAPNVRGQLHKPNGTLIKTNWIIAGGTGSQHSANAVHLGNNFIVFYADEAPPSTGGAVVKGKVIDDLTGNETQTIIFTPNNEDHWWPVSVSNKTDTRAFVIWGNDGYSIRGTVLYENQGTVQQAQPPQDYLLNTQQYFYQVIWLENISKFLIIARNGAYDDITDESQICLIDTMGNIVTTKTINGGIIREAKPSAIWSSCTQSYHIFYPTGTNKLVHFEVTSNFEVNSSDTIFTNSELANVQWVSTGTWSVFVHDINDNDDWQNNHIILFIYNDENSNNIVKTPVHISNDVLCQSLGIISTEKNTDKIIIYPNPASNVVFIKSYMFNNQTVKIKVYNTIGKLILSHKKVFKGNKTSINIQNLSTGIYFIELIKEKENKKQTIKLIKR